MIPNVLSQDLINLTCDNITTENEIIDFVNNTHSEYGDTIIVPSRIENELIFKIIILVLLLKFVN